MPNRPWLWIFLILLFHAVTLVIIVLLFYAEEDWRGAHLLTKTKAAWQARGESFDPGHFLTAAVPDGLNLAAAPLFKMQYEPKEDSWAPRALDEAFDPLRHGGPLPRTDEADFPVATARLYAAAFPKATPPAGALAQLEALYPVLRQLRAEAALRPEFQLDSLDHGRAWNRPLGLLTGQIKVVRLLSLHARLALREHRPDVALDDVRLILRLSRGTGRDPSLVGGLVAIATGVFARIAINDGVEHHTWADAQLAALPLELERLDYLAQYQFSLRAELVTVTLPLFAMVKAQRGSLAHDVRAVNRDSPPRETALALFRDSWPEGWWDLNAAQVIGFVLREVHTVDPGAHRVFPDVAKRLADEEDDEWSGPVGFLPWNYLSTIAAAPFTTMARNTARMQTSIDQARIACALERCRLAQGKYPATLDALAPAFIDAVPRDIINGEPYRYRLNADDTFLLYSVGWNQTDDGGKEVDEPGRQHRDDTQGDWVWPMAR
ncbi:MAG: hypothetical protein WDO13_12195 [Verrucomicrobiota bacterium]